MQIYRYLTFWYYCCFIVLYMLSMLVTVTYLKLPAANNYSSAIWPAGQAGENRSADRGWFPLHVAGSAPLIRRMSTSSDHIQQRALTVTGPSIWNALTPLIQVSLLNPSLYSVQKHVCCGVHVRACTRAYSDILILLYELWLKHLKVY